MQHKIKKNSLFVLMSIISGIVDFLIYIITIKYSNYLIAGIAGFLGGMICNFLLNKKFTFKSKRKKRKDIQLYTMVAGINLLIYEISLYTIMFFLIYFDIKTFISHEITAKIIASLIITFIGYILHKNITFRHIRN